MKINLKSFVKIILKKGGFIVAFVIPYLTLLGYNIAYSYERSLLSSFGIPEEYVFVTVESVLRVTSMLVYFLIILYFLLTNFGGILDISKSKKRISRTEIFLLFMLLLILSSFIENIGIYLIITALIIVFIFNFGHIINFFSKIEKKYFPKKNNYQINTSKYSNTSIKIEDIEFELTLQTKSFIIFLLLSILSIGPPIFSILSLHNVHKEKNYLTFSSHNKKYVVLSVNPNKYIAIDYNEKTKKVGHEIRIISNTDNIIFTSEKILLK